MVASRGNVILAILGIYLILGFLTTFVFSEKEEWTIEKRKAFQKAGCLADFRNDTTRQKKCHELTDDQINRWVSHDYIGLANFNGSLFCKDINEIRIKHNLGVWVIEQSMGNDSWEKTIGSIEVSEGMITAFTNLEANTLYRYKAYRVSENGVISKPEISPWFETLELAHVSEGIEYATVLRHALHRERNYTNVRSHIFYQPASDRSCHGEIVWRFDQDFWISEPAEAKMDVERSGFQVCIWNIHYEVNLTVRITPFNSGHRLGKNHFFLNFTTPSCKQMRDSYDNVICAPEKVKGLRAKFINENSSETTLEVTWDLPDLIPDGYVVSYVYGKDVSRDTLPGNTTKHLFKGHLCHGDLHCHIRIYIVAKSIGGNWDDTFSDESWIDVYLNKTTSLTSPDVENADFYNGIIVVPALAILALVFGLAYAYYPRRQSAIEGGLENINEEFGHNLDPAINGSNKNLELANLEFEKKTLPVPKDKFEIHPGQLKIKDILGSGVCGIVRLSCYQISKNRAINVAVKTLKDDPSDEDVKNFHREISIMKTAGHHQNIVSIIGYCTIGVAKPMLVVEYCPQGDLQTYLRTFWQKIINHALESRAHNKMAIQEDVTPYTEAKQIAITNKLYDFQVDIANALHREDISAEDLLSFARQVACGMKFLSSKRIIHRDLAARNVLVCTDKVVKISDFGLSRDIYLENAYKKRGSSRLPIKWMAPESLTHQVYTIQSDVWSFGILLWEIVTLGCYPYPDIPTNTILQHLNSGYRMEKPENCGEELYDVMLSCWRWSPLLRPKFHQLHNQLDNLLANISKHEYLKLYDLLPDSS